MQQSSALKKSVRFRMLNRLVLIQERGSSMSMLTGSGGEHQYRNYVYHFEGR